MSSRLLRAAMRTGLNSEDAEDAVLNVAVALWERRTDLAEMSVGAFWAFAFRAVRNQALDRLRRQARLSFAALDEEHDIPADEMAYVDEAVAELLDDGALDRAANRLWLGNDEGAAAQCLALQLCLRQGLSWPEAAELAGLPQEVRLTPAAARYALFAALMWSHDALATHVLRPAEPVERLLARLHRGEAVSAEGWGPLETATVILHICHAMNAAQIERHLGENGDFAEAIDRAVCRYPFPALVAAAARLPHPSLADALRDSGLWKRIVFEYGMRMHLPHRQILERAAPAAAEAEVKMSETTLNSWIGNGRLWSQLASFMREDRSIAT